MSRLIDADEAAKNTHKEIYWTESEQASVRNFLSHQPTINPDDLRPRGRWIVKKEMLNMRGILGVRCSACGQYWALVEDNDAEYMNHFKFCPNCGAKMEEEK